VARVAIVLALAVIPLGVNLQYVDAFDRQVTTYAAYFAKEVALGFVLGYLVGWVFWAVQSAGALIDNQRGSSMASSIDPLQGQETSTLGIAFSQVFLTYIYIAGGVLPIIGLLYRSFALWPATRALPVVGDRFPALVLGVFDQAARFVVVIGAPIVAVMFLAEFALAMVSRFAPQIQVFVLAMPIKSGLAMFMLIFYFSTLLPYAAGATSLFPNYLASLYDLLDQAARR
jgi:type III secretion protein T